MTATVLLVEDEDDTRESLARSLERAGFRCLPVRSAAEALAIARGDEFVDVVVTDVVLGRDDDRGGLRLLDDLRAAGMLAPVVVITAYADVDKVKTALNAGAAHLLEKPFRASDLCDVIRRVQRAPSTLGAGVQHAVAQVLGRANLTDKEREVARFLLEGLSVPEIAERSGNSPKTIRQHVTRIYEEFGVGSHVEFFRLVYPR
jgi:DNA-binding NarL/FixJ family response regulator